MKNAQRTAPEIPKELYQPRYWKSYFDVGLGYTLILLILLLNIWVKRLGLNSILTISLLVFSALLMGLLQHYLFLFLHEGAHYHLSPTPKWNDRITNFFIGAWFFQEVSQYRKLHFAHHGRLGTMGDPENSYFFALTPLQLLARASGFYAIQKLFKWKEYHRSRGEPSNTRAAALGVWTMFVLYNSVLLLLCYLIGGWVQYLCLWVFPFCFLFPLFSSLRQNCEHRPLDLGRRDLSFETVQPCARSFKKSLFSLLYGAAGFRLHQQHHQYPFVPYTRLDELDGLLSRETRNGLVCEAKVGYVSTFLFLIRDAWMTDNLFLLNTGLVTKTPN